MRHTISIIIVLSCIWLLNSGHYTPLLLTFGVVSILFVTWLVHRMDVVDHESQPMQMTFKLPGYYFWLLRQIVRSNIDVVYRIWRGNSSISPTVATITVSQQTSMGKVIYANSLTLTPGTVSMDLEGDQITIHSLTEEGVAQVLTGAMDQRVSALEKN